MINKRNSELIMIIKVVYGFCLSAEIALFCGVMVFSVLACEGGSWFVVFDEVDVVFVVFE